MLYRLTMHVSFEHTVICYSLNLIPPFQIRKSLQLEELLQREETEYIIEEQVAKCKNRLPNKDA